MDDIAGTLEEWSGYCGIQKMPGMELTTEDGVDFGFTATVDIAANTPLLFIPSQVILSSQQAYELVGDGGGRACNARDLLQRFGNGSEQHFPHLCLWILVLMEYEKGDASPWYAWLNTLPRRYNNGAAMTPFCFRCLPPLIAALAKEERTRLINFEQVLRQMYKNVLVSDDIKDNMDVLRWAYNAVYTRFVTRGSEEPVLVPLVDYLNHGTWPNVDLYFDDDGNCQVYTTEEVSAGSALQRSYGDPTNPSFLFARYGFLDESSPATFCKIMIDKPSTELINLGYDPSRMLFFKDTGEVSQEVWDVLLYDKVLSKEDSAVQEQFYQAHIAGDDDTKQAMHAHYYPQTAAALNDHVEGFLLQLQELSAQGVGRDVREHPRLPLILKHNIFVMETFLTVKMVNNL